MYSHMTIRKGPTGSIETTSGLMTDGRVQEDTINPSKDIHGVPATTLISPIAQELGEQNLLK